MELLAGERLLRLLGACLLHTLAEAGTFGAQPSQNPKSGSLCGLLRIGWHVHVAPSDCFSLSLVDDVSKLILNRDELLLTLSAIYPQGFRFA